MFEQTFVEAGKTKRAWTVMVAFLVRLLFIGDRGDHPDDLLRRAPKGQLTSFLVAPPPPPPPPPPPAAAPVKVVKVIPRQFDAGRLMAPKVIPKEVATIKEEELPPPTSGVAGVVGGVPGGVPAELRAACLAALSVRCPVRAAASSSASAGQEGRAQGCTRSASRVGGNVQQAKLVRQPRPVYPPLAKQARIQGVVRPQRHHSQGWHDSESRGDQRPSAAGSVRSRSGETVGVPADSAERRAGGSGDSDRRELHVEPVRSSGALRGRTSGRDQP